MIDKGKIVKVKWIEFENLETGLKCEHIDFFDNTTLLVGMSGAGKSQIINVIYYSLSLALGRTKYLLPYKTCLCIDIDDHIYEWAYTIKKTARIDYLSFDENREYIFIYEHLCCDGKLIFKREKDNLAMSSFEKIPSPKRSESLICQYAEDASFKQIVSGIKRIYNVDTDVDIHSKLRKDTFNDLKKFINKKIKNKPDFEVFSHLPCPIKLSIAKEHYKSLYEDIFWAVHDIFNEIEDIGVGLDVLSDSYCIEIKVYGKKLQQDDISNGMLKTIYYIVELFTSPENSLILIDELENGLGINCIEKITELIEYQRIDLQYIITSHHPLIIGNVDYNEWRIIERDKNIIHNFDCNSSGYDFNNRHDAYYNLVNKWSYEGKI